MWTCSIWLSYPLSFLINGLISLSIVVTDSPTDPEDEYSLGSVYRQKY